MANESSAKSSSAAAGESSTTGKILGAAAGVAAAVVAGAVAVKAVRKRNGSSDEESIFHLKQADEGWVLEIEGESTPSARFDTKDQGLAAARELAHQSAPCELVIYRTDGSVQDRHTYSE